MDVRELLRKQGISSFTAADFEFVTSKIAADPSRLILVGGQSVAVWGIIFDVASPLGAHQTLTKDADWLGGKLDAKWLCDQLGPSSDVDLQFAADFDVTPSSALAFLRRDNRVLMMDFLRSIVGPENAEIQELAVSVVLQDSSMLVMHPLLCLESRFANLKELPAKRQGNGPLQAIWMINIMRAYFLEQAAQGIERKQVAKAIRRVVALAESQQGKYCLLNFQLNAMNAIPPEVISYVGGGFESIEWPKVAERVEKNQERWRKNKERRSKKAPSPETA